MIRRVSGRSMEPALKAGQLVLATRRVKKLKASDVIIFKHKGLEKIKRVNSIAGDDISVIGDNKNHSTDSRSFGPINSKEIIGRVIYII